MRKTLVKMRVLPVNLSGVSNKVENHTTLVETLGVVVILREGYNKGNRWE